MNVAQREICIDLGATHVQVPGRGRSMQVCRYGIEGGVTGRRPVGSRREAPTSGHPATTADEKHRVAEEWP